MAKDNVIQLFNNIQLEKIINNQIDFLKLIYPFLAEESYHKECMELRPIQRAKGSYTKSLNLWRLDDKGKEEYKKFINKINGQALCLYYSGYTLDYTKIVYKPDGSTYEKGKINKENALYTQILPIDFDGIEVEEYKKYIDILKTFDIEPISIYTGHGFQTLILLNEKVYSKELYNIFTNLLLSKGWPVDSKIIDSARILRMPFTFNCKAFDKNSNHYSPDDPQPIPVKIIQSSKKRYELEYILNSIESIITLDINKENFYFELKKNLTKDNISSLNTVNDITTNTDISVLGDFVEVKSIRDIYNIINFDNMPEAIQSMLIETPELYRNSVMLFLIPFFRNKYGFSLEKIIAIFRIWGSRCNPPLDDKFVISEVKRIYSLDYMGTGAYTKELSDKFGYIKFDEYKRDNKIIISNDFFDSYNILSDTSVKIYLMMKVFEKLEDIKSWSRNDIMRAADISDKTFKRNIEELIISGFIDKTKGVKREGQSYTYYINRYFDSSKGFTIFETATLENMVYNKNRALNNGEIKLYTYMCKMIGTNKEYCYASQNYLGNVIGKARNTISEITDNLSIKKYIKKDAYFKNFKEHCIYTLNY